MILSKRIFISLFLGITISGAAQVDSSLFKRVQPDTSKPALSMDAIYNRPFLNINKTPVSIGGYVETNYQHISEGGVSDGHEFQFRRLSIFLSSSISKKIKFLSEIEFENDKDEELEGKPMEIDIEYAAIDVEFNPLLNLRSGIVLNPIGAFNQNHDGPKWEFTNRPIAMTEMLPATFSNAGFGLYGKKYSKDFMFGYEVYLTGGFDNSIIDNDHNKTFLPEAKENSARLVTSNSGSPLVSAKLSFRHNAIGELGVSYMGGIYNKWTEEGVKIDDKRSCRVFDIDFNTTLPKINTNITGEWAWVNVELPSNYNEQFGNKQHGGFIDIVQPVIKREIAGWDNATINIGARLEYVDWNVGTFKTSGTNKADDLWAITPSISFRPTAQTVLRLNYLHQRQRDIMGNPPSNTGGFVVGLSTYF